MVQRLIQLSPFILIGFAMCLYGVSAILAQLGKKDPARDSYDEWAEKSHWFADLFFQGIEALAGLKGWKGAEKLAEMTRLMKATEALWLAGKKTEATTQALAFFWDAVNKNPQSAPGSQSPQPGSK